MTTESERGYWRQTPTMEELNGQTKRDEKMSDIDDVSKLPPIRETLEKTEGGTKASDTSDMDSLFEEAIIRDLDIDTVDESLLELYDVFTLTKKGNTRINVVGLAKLIMEEHGFHFRTIVDQNSGSKDVFYYKNGYYHPGGEFIIKKLCNLYLKDKTTNARKREVVGYIEDSDFAFREDLEPEAHILNLRNGVLNIHTGELKEHSYDYGFINQLPIEYDETAECPKIMQFMKEIFPDTYKKYIDVIQEMFGYCLLRKYFIHVAFILYGGGRNGKSVLLNLLCNMLGKDNYSTRQLHELMGDKFAKADLFGKMANICTEISGREISDGANFKALTGGDWVTGRYIYRGPFVFKNYAKLIFNSNKIPPTQDKTFAFYQRWKIIVFSQTFPRGEPRTIPNLDEKLSTPEELSGLLNWCIEGLKRLLANKDFTKATHEEDESEQYEKLSNPEVAFINDFLEIDADSRLEKEEVYTRYKTWCEANMYPIITKNMLTKAIQDVLPEVITKGEIVTSLDTQKSVPAYARLGWLDDYAPPRQIDEQTILDDIQDGKRKRKGKKNNR